MACARELETLPIKAAHPTQQVAFFGPYGSDYSADWEAEVSNYLEENIASFEVFSSRLLQSIVQRESELCRAYALPSSPITLPNIDCVYDQEIQVFRATYEDLLMDLEDLKWFERVNFMAITRIFAKISNNSNDEGAFEQQHSRWLAVQRSLDETSAKTLGRVKKLVTEILGVLSRTRRATHSWGIASLLSHRLADKATQDMMYELFINDQHALIKTYFLSGKLSEVITTTDSRRIVGKIYRIAAVMGAKKTSKMALEAMLREEVSAEQVFSCMETWEIRLKACLHQSRNINMEMDLFSEHLSSVLDSLGSKALDLLQQDYRGGLLLHQMAKRNLTSLCEVMSSVCLREDAEVSAEILISIDCYGKTPLHYAVDGGNVSMLVTFLNTLYRLDIDEKIMRRVRTAIGDVFVSSVRSGADQMVGMIMEHDFDIQHQSSRGETALYCAARVGDVHLIRSIALRVHGQEFAVNVTEKTRGWTPLIVACANGHALAAELLLLAGAEPNIQDARGWTALEHAIFRGHHTVADLLKIEQTTILHDGPAAAVRSLCKETHSLCNADEKKIIVHLGSTQGGHSQPAIQLGRSNPIGNDRHHQELPLELHISISGSDSATRVIHLPILEDQLHRPLVFKAQHCIPFRLTLKLYRCESIDSKVLISSGTSLLDDDGLLGEKYESLIRERSIYLIDLETPSQTGAVLLSYVVVKPFTDLKQAKTPNPLISTSNSVQLIGHRGNLIPYTCLRSIADSGNRRVWPECGRSVITPTGGKYIYGRSSHSRELQSEFDIASHFYLLRNLVHRSLR